MKTVFMCFVFFYLAIDNCKLPKEPGMCLASFKRWYYNNTTKKCEQFVYGGCGGNGNNFRTSKECYSECIGITFFFTFFILFILYSKRNVENEIFFL